MSNAPVPADLRKVLEETGAASAAILRKSAIPVGRRVCGNCGYNPTGQFCQRWPLDACAVLQPPPAGSSEPGIFVKPYPRPVPTDWWCGEHRYPHEVNRRDAVPVAEGAGP